MAGRLSRNGHACEHSEPQHVKAVFTPVPQTLATHKILYSNKLQLTAFSPPSNHGPKVATGMATGIPEFLGHAYMYCVWKIP